MSRTPTQLSSIVRVLASCMLGFACTSIAAAQTGGAYAPCVPITASPSSHFASGRATRTTSDGTKYWALGSGVQLTGTSVTLAQTAYRYYEKLSSCPLPPGCARAANQPASGLDLRCATTPPGTTLARAYDMHVPNNYTNLDATSARLPMVMEMHGGGGGAVPPSTEAISGWLEVSDTSVAPFIVVWPVGSNEDSGPFGEEWQTCNYDDTAGSKCPATGYPHDRNFLIDVVTKVAANFKIDKKKLYATGLSSGAAMVHALACKYSEFFAAVAPMAYGIQVTGQPRSRDNYDMRTKCAAAVPENGVTKRKVPVFYAHSPHDRTSSFAQGQATVSFFESSYGGCGTAVTTSQVEFDIVDPTDLAMPQWDLTACRTKTCAGGATKVALCAIDGSSGILNAYGHIIWWGDDLHFPVFQPNQPRLAQWAWDWMRPFSAPDAESKWPPQPTAAIP